ncbi:GDSL-type esterase/lipase family protein [Salinibacterium soli]|uniref:SGNH/GDSL hydrolase family protein n=1 Tax=Antiquaquibacter soli TaxID=3064523 RepID=A0ABT9BSR9_9MICO|nr:GDSL-type esterase/lipase family protein [Protaetiibacter sp. WY-16]MDO7883448.1 SGNH/GDSL hydrolase family protein [Protaetiibacter sp. WY-16]
MDAVRYREVFPSRAVEVVGALDLPVSGAGRVRPRRLPAWTRSQMPSENFDFVVSMTSGVRIVTRTAATVIELVADFVSIAPPGIEPAPVVLELVVEGVPRARRVVRVDHSTLVDPERYAVRRQGEPAAVRFSGLEPGEKTVELWLPHTCAVDLLEIRSDAPLRTAERSRPRWVHHGSSISQGGEASAPTRTWPVVAARLAGVDVLNLGFSGNAVGDPFVARTIRDLPADAISLEIGINVVNGDLMRRRAFEPVMHGFLDTIRDGHPDAPLLLIGPIPCPSVESLPGPTVIRGGMAASAGDPRQLAEGAMSLSVVRDALAAVLRNRRDDALHYLDGRALLRPAEVSDLDDGLHPNARALVRMGQRFARTAFAEGGPLAPRLARSASR